MKTGVAVFKHKDMGVYAFGALCALKELGIQIDCISVSSDSVLCGLLFQKGYSLEEGKTIYQTITQQSEKKSDLWNEISKQPDRNIVLVVCKDGRIYCSRGEGYNLFGKIVLEWDNLVLDNNGINDLCNKEQLFWVLNSMGAEKVICIEGEESKYQQSIGKNPSFTLTASNGQEWQFLLNDGYEQIMKRKNELLDAIYFAGRY